MKLNIILLFLILTQKAFCWSGNEIKTNIEIEISPGNLVREGLIINIFDWESNKYHDVEILEMESSFNGTTLKVTDMELNKERIFEME